MKLLNIDANPKTVKGQAYGYMTAILYLSPYILGGPNLCPTAELAGCWQTCLNVQGRGRIAARTMQAGEHALPDNTIQRARLARTRMWHESRGQFLEQLSLELAKFVDHAARKGLHPVVRLNGTSDIPFERVQWGAYANVMEAFPDVQFYDYTKLPTRVAGERRLPANYHLSLSWSGTDAHYRNTVERVARETGAPLVVVTRDGYRNWVRPSVMQVAERAGCTHSVDGDAHDLRFLERPHSLVVLRAKGSARNEANGFVLGVVS